MRSKFLIIVLVSLCSVTSAQKKKLDLDSIAGDPILTLEKGYEVDLGEVFYEDSVFVKLPFTNTGTGPLKISRVRTSCSCTEPVISDKAVLPGEKGTISLWYHANDDVNRGYSQVRVHYNGTKSPAFINLTAKIVLDK